MVGNLSAAVDVLAEAPTQPSSSFTERAPENTLAKLRKAFTAVGLLISEEIGRGGMGVVFGAHDTTLERPVAVKMNSNGDNPQLIESFRQEAITLAQVDHPNVVTILRTGVVHIDGRAVPFHVMKLVTNAQNGTKLFEACEIAQRDLPLEACLVLVSHIAKGLKAAHLKSIIHRDVKPGNVLIPKEIQELLKQWKEDRDDQTLIRGLKNVDQGLLVTDFGLARAGKGGPDDNEGEIAGTPGYIPKEGYEAPEKVDHKADVFALYVILFQLLFRKEMPPGSPKSVTDYFVQVAKKDDSSAPKGGKDQVIEKILEKGRKDRQNYDGIAEMMKRMKSDTVAERPTMAEVVTALEQILDQRSEKSQSLRHLKKRLKQVIAAGLVIGALGLFERWREGIHDREERRRIYFALKGALEKRTGKQCLCEYLEECQKNPQFKNIVDEVPTEKDFETVLTLSQEVDKDFHQHRK